VSAVKNAHNFISSNVKNRMPWITLPPPPPATTVNFGNKLPCYILCTVNYFFRPESAVTLNNKHHFHKWTRNWTKTNNDHFFRTASVAAFSNTYHLQNLVIKLTTAKPSLIFRLVSDVLLPVGVNNCDTKYYSLCGITAVIVSYKYHFHMFGSNKALRTVNQIWCSGERESW